MSLQITQANFLALIQDLGRKGYQHMGVTAGGPMDEHAFLWANYLLGNESRASQIEITYGAFSAVFTQPTMIALGGADLSATLNQQRIFPWQTYVVKAGDNIQFVSPNVETGSAIRAYLAVQGGFGVPTHFSSCATVMREKMGGLNCDGQKLLKNDVVAYHKSEIDFSRDSHRLIRHVPEQFIPQYSQQVSLRYIPNEASNGFPLAEQVLFSHQIYSVSQQSDRMGYRLTMENKNDDQGSFPDTQTIKNERKKLGLISQGVSVGTIQIPPDGQPIVLMRDRQTMGGYPIMGCVAYQDIAKLAQCAPNAQVSFIPTDVQTLEAEMMQYQQFFGVE